MGLELDDGASTEIMDQRGILPLHHATSEQKEAVVQLLLDRGAKPRLTYGWSHFESLLHSTMIHSSLAVLQVLLAYFDKVMKSANGALPQGIATSTEALRITIRWEIVRTLDALIVIWKAFDDTIYEGQEEVGTILDHAARHRSLASMKWVWAQPNILADIKRVGG